MNNIPFLSIVIIVAIASIDLFALVRTRFYKSKEYKDVKQNNNFTILVPIFNKISYLKNVDFLKKYPHQVILCTSTSESKEFMKELKELAEKYKFKVHQSDLKLKSANHKPNPWHIFRDTLNTSNLVKESLEKSIEEETIILDTIKSIDTEYCIFVDGDTHADDDLNRVIGAMAEENFDISSVRILAANTENTIEKLQNLEYTLAMDARRIYPWLTSGAAIISRTKIIREVMKHHSLFFNGGDIEIGKLSKILKFSVGHLPFVFKTEVPTTFKSWFKQRMAWFAGGFRHTILNMHQEIWKSPFYFFYVTVLIYLLFPMRVYDSIRYPYIVVILLIVYWVFLRIAFIREFKIWYLLFPFYAFTQIMIILPCGIYFYFRSALIQRNLGIISTSRRNREHRDSRISKGTIWFNRIAGLLIALLTIGLVSFYSVERVSSDIEHDRLASVNTNDQVKDSEKQQTQAIISQPVSSSDVSEATTQAIVPTEPPIPVKQPFDYTYTATSGASLSTLSVLAMRDYERENSKSVDNTQRAYIQGMTLAVMKYKAVRLNERVSFDVNVLRDLYNQSANLSFYEREAWSRYANSVIW